MKAPKAIIFDFGNVIINIDVPKTYQAFSQITRKPAEKVDALFKETQLFKRYETGELDDYDFRDFVRSLFNQPLTDREIDEAWNSLLLDIPAKRIQLLQDLRRRYPIYLLSNTNPIHIRQSLNYLRKTYQIFDFSALFDRTFLSYEMGLWKPDPKIYQQTLRAIGYEAADVLFFDDNAQNIESARSLGMNSILIEPDKFTILEYFQTIDNRR